MFKRVEKRRRKKDKEEELGLNEDMKEVLGIQDTDSDESDSDSDSEKGSKAGSEEVVDEFGGIEDEDRDGADNEVGSPRISVEDALADPVYPISLEPDLKGCITCPGKLLKHPKMVEVHKASNAHRRRFTRFIELAGHASPDDNASDILQKNGTTKTTEDNKQSKRSEKRKAKLAAIKVKRERQEQMKSLAKAKQKEKVAEAKAAAAPSLNPKDKPLVEEPAKKKQKLDQDKKPKSKHMQQQPMLEPHREKASRISAEDHKRGELAGDKSKSKTERKQKRHGGSNSILKIFD